MSENLMYTCSTNEEDIFCKFKCDIDKSEIDKIINRSVIINGITYHPSLLSEEIDVIIRLIQSEWSNIQSIALYNDVVPYNEIVVSRELLNKYMNLIKISLHACNDIEQRIRYLEEMFEVINLIINFIVPLNELEPEVLLKIAAVNINNKKCPIYQYFHTNLEIHYNLLIIVYFCNKPSVLNDHIQKITQNLIAVCKKYFKRFGSGNVLSVCPCVKQFFVILQLITEKVNCRNSYWEIFNNLLENDEPLFSFSLLKEIVARPVEERGNYLDISPNFELIETKMKSFLNDAEADTVLKVFKIVDVLANELWLKTAKIEVYQTIWDYYSKRLNVSNKNYAKLSSIDVYKILENILGARENCKEDFELFVAMLIVHLKKHPDHWGKLKGRIYSQLGTNKLKELSETGVAHVSMLFIALSHIFYNDMQKRIYSVFEVFTKEKKEYPIVWNVYMAFVFQDVKEFRDLEKTAIGMKPMLQNACSDGRSFYFIRHFLFDFKYCMDLNQNMTLHQWTFFDTWLDKYLSTCSIQDLKAALDVFLCVLEILIKTDSWTFWKSVFKNNIYPPLKKIAVTFNAPEEIGKIVGMISILDLELSESIFNFFTSDVSPKVSNQFLLVIMDDYRNKFVLSEHQKSLFVQSWIRIGLLTGELSQELTNKFLQLDIFPPSLKSYIGSSKSPLFALIEYLGSDIENHLQSTDIYKICENSFGHIDKWLTQYLYLIEDNVVIHRIFIFISLAFLHCGRLLYNRNKISTPLTKLVEVVLLPQEIMLGKPPQHTVLNAVNQTWHLFFEGLVNLNSDCDMYLERTLRDMLTKYVPFFTTADCPFIKCLNKEETAKVLMEKIAMSYFRYPVKETNTNILKVLKILKYIIESTTSISIIKIFIDKTLFSIFEFIILHPQRNAAFAVVKAVTVSPLYPQINKEFCDKVIAISEKHLAHNTNNYFQLLYIVTKFVPVDMKNLLSVIKHHVSNVERLRGVGFDKNLRMQFEKFESIINENV